MNNDEILRGSNVIQLVPDESVAKLQVGDPKRLTADQFVRLSKAFFADLERKFI